ncbi:MAG TPA: hypothetical protein VF837_01690, partial [Patescibacteria group bacterium]
MAGKFLMIACIFAIIILTFSKFIQPHPAYAAVSNWQKGATIMPQSSTDYSSFSFKQSLANLASIHAGYVTLIVPWYQSNLYSVDFHTGWNTPTDASLIDAIKSAHTLGLKVNLKIHAESDTGEWRAHINPSDRNTWFTNYGNILNHYAVLAQNNGVEEYTIGAELYDMTSPNVNSTNTDHWRSLIAAVRKLYSGSLTYSAQHTTPTEEIEIQFWDALDTIGLAAYFPLATYTANPTLDQLTSSWNDWNNSIIAPLSAKWSKPVVFTEVGYRSVSGANIEPAAYWRQGSVDLNQQSLDYQALFQYWDAQPFMTGLQLWDWSSNPGAGGSNDSNFTPQNKPAQTLISQWYAGSAAAPSPSPSPTLAPLPSKYNISASFNNPAVNVSLPVTININPDSSLSDSIIDIEIYNSSGNQMFQQYFEHQNLAANQNNQFNISWTPPSAGNFVLKTGIFSNNWQTNFWWADHVADINTNVPFSTPTPTSAPQTTPTLTPTPTSVAEPSPTSVPPVTVTPQPASTDISIWWPADNATV